MKVTVAASPALNVSLEERLERRCLVLSSKTVVVCDPRKNALSKSGNKSDRIDARKLADLLRSGLLSSVYRGESGIRILKELARTYLVRLSRFSTFVHRLPQTFRHNFIDAEFQNIYLARQIELGSLKTSRLARGRKRLTATAAPGSVGEFEMQPLGSNCNGLKGLSQYGAECEMISETLRFGFEVVRATLC